MRSPIDRLVAAGSRSAARAKNFSPSERSSLRRDVLALVREGNESVAPERQVTYRSAARVVNRALRENASLESRSRRVAALRALSAFISLSVHGSREGVEPRNTDLLPVGHPLSSAPHAMTASALRRSRAQWLSVDPRIADDVRPLVASAFSHEPGTIESQHALTRLSALPAGSVPAEFLVTDTLEALIADGNSRAARSARARAQRRDRKGRWAEMGGGVRLLLGRSRFDLGQMVTGRVVGYPEDGVSLDLQLPDGSIVRVPANKTEGVRAILPDSALPDNPSASDGPDSLISDDFDLVVANYVDAPAGWRKVDAESSDGVTTFTDDEYKITRYDKIDKELGARVNKAGGANQKNPGSFDLRGGGADPTGKWNKDLPLYEIRNEETGKVVGYAQDWADTLGIVDDNANAMDAKKAGDAEVKAKLDTDKAATDAEVAEWSSKRQSDYAAHVEERKDALEAQIADGVDAQGRPVPSNWSPELPGTYDSPRAPEAPGSAEERSAYNYEKSNPDAVPSFDKSSTDFIDDVEYSTDLNGDRVTVSQRDGKLELDGASFDDWDGVQAALPEVAQKRYDASRERMANALEKVGVDKSIVDMVRDGASKDDVSAALSDDETWSDAQNDLATSGDVDLPQKYQRDAWDATREANDALNGLKNEPQIAELPQPEQIAELPEGTTSAESTWEPADTRQTIPWETLVFDEETGKAKLESGEAEIIDYAGRKIVVMDINGTKVPFYLSTGAGGKAGVEAGRWYPFFGIGEDGWINKLGEAEINDYYDSPELRAAAEWLDANVGDVRDDTSIPKTKATGDHVDFINSDLDAADNEKSDTRAKVDANIDKVRDGVRKDASAPEIELPEAPEITELPAPVSSKSFDFDVPEGAHRLELDFFDPEGRTDQDSPDYTDDPRVLAQKFSDEQLTDALAEAIIAQKNFADTFLEQLDSEPLDDDVDDAAPKKKGKTGPKPKKKISTTASGLGKLSFEYGDEFVPAEALYLALQERGADVDMIVADMYDMRAGNTKNRDALTESRGESVARLEVGQDSPEILPELDEIFDEAEDVDEPETPEAPYISDRQQQSLSIVAAIDAIDVDSLDPAVKELNDLILSLELPANEDEAAENLDRITDEIAPALYAVLTDTATDTERAKVQAWWGIFSHLDNGDGAEDSIAVSAMAHSVAVYMGMDIGDEDAIDELNRRIYSTLGSSRDFKNSKVEFANGDTGGEMYGAFAQFLATAASPNESTLYRGMDVSTADEDFKLFTTEGSVVNFDPTSWSQSQSTADMYAKRYYPPQGDRVGVIFKLDPGEGTSVNMERYSWYFGEHEDVTWGQYVVDSVVESEGEAFTGEKKITYEVNLRPMTMSEWARYNADGDYSSLLADNVDIDFPEGYHTPSADAYEPEFPEGDNYEGVPEGFTDSPLYLAEMWETDDLIDQLRAGIEDGSGLGTFEYPLDDGFEANIPVEAIRDALQIQGFDTNEIMQDIANTGDGVDVNTDTNEPDVAPAESIAANEITAIRDETALEQFDISSWKQVGAQLGSNPGGFYGDENGNAYYVKYPKSQVHAENEVLASALYRAAGVDAASIYFGRDGNGDLVTVSPLIDGATTDFASRLDDPQYKDKTQAGFAVDAWLANWDVAGLVFDNVVTDSNGDPVRVDPGGALIFRAQGAPKGGAFGNEVTELDTLRDPSMNPQSYAVFGDMSNDAARDSARKLLPMTPDKIEDMVNAVVTDPELAKELSDKLKARRQYIIDYFSLNDEQPEAQVSNYIDTEKDLPPGASAPEPAGVPDDYTPPVVTADEPEAPAPAASTAADAYLSSDGTPLQIGMKVRSTKDGLEAEVVKFDKNPKYVFVKDASGKKIVRSTKTLEIVTDSGASDVTPEPEPELMPEPDAAPVPEPEAVEPAAPATYQDVFQGQMDALNELAKNNPYEVPIADIADALGISPYSDMYEYLAKRHPSFFENNGNPDSIPTSLLSDVRDGFSSDGSDDVDRIVQDVVLNGPKAAQEYDLMPIGDAYMELRASMLDSENDGSYSDADLRDVVIENRTAIEEAMYNGDLYVTIAPPGGYEVNLDLRAAIPVLQTTPWKPPPVKDDFSDAGASMPDAVEAPEPEPEASAPQQSTGPDLSLPYMEPAGKVVKSVSKSQLEATNYSGTVGDGISYEIKGEMVAHYNAWGKYDGNTAGVTLTLKGKTFPIKDALKKAGYRYDGSTKSWSITKKPGLGTGDIDDALASIYAGLEKIGPVTGEHYDANFKEDVPDVDAPTSDDGELADWEKELLGIDATSDAAEPSDLTPPPGAPTLPDANGNPIWVGAKVVDAQGNEGTVTKLQPNGTYIDVKFPDGTKKARSIKKVVVSGTGDVPVSSTKTTKPKKSAKPTPTGAPAVVVDEPLNWNESSFDEVNSLSGALATVRQDTDSASRGASFAADAGDIEDLDVRVMRVLDENGNESIMLKYRLTDWAGADLAKKLYADPNTKIDNLNVKKMKTVEALDSPYGLLQLVDDASYKSWAGRTLNYDVDTASGTAKITVHRANTNDSKTLSKDSPRAFHNLVQIVLPGNATEADIADALKAAGINDVRPATPDDAKIVIENRVLSVFGKETNPAKNLKGPAREQKLQDIYDSWGFTADDVRVVRGADGRVEYRLTPEIAQKIMSKTGVKAVLHNLTTPAKTPSGRLLHSGSTEERREAWLEYYLLLFGGNHDGLLSTSTRWSEGVGYSGMSSNSDVISGGADYVFTTPKSYRPSNSDAPYGFNPTIVFRADSLFERLDIYANQYDSYGKRSNTHDIIKNINGNTYELMFKNRLSWEDLDFVKVPDETLRDELIDALKARGIFSLGGVPIEQIFLKPGDAVPDLTPEERAKLKAAMQKIAQ